MPTTYRSAYDTQYPNGSGRRQPNDRVILVFRLYHVLPPQTQTSFPSLNVSDAGVVDVIEKGLTFVRDAIRWIAPSSRILISELRVPLLVNRVEFVPDARIAFGYTQAGYYVDKIHTPPYAQGVTRISIQGSTYWTPFVVNGVPMDGESAFQALDNLFDEYLNPRVNPLPAGGHSELQMIYLMNAPSAEDQFWKQEWTIIPSPTGVRQQQSSSQPFLRKFSLNLIGLDNNSDRRKRQGDGFLSDLLGKGFLRDLLTVGGYDLIGIIDTIYGTARKWVTTLDEINSAIKQVTDYATGLQVFILDGIGIIRSAITGIEQIIGTLEDAVDQIAAFPDLLSDELDRFKQTFPGLSDGNPEPLMAGLTQAKGARDFLMAALVAETSYAIPTSPSAALAVPIRIPTVGSLVELAAANGVTNDSLIVQNNLQWPFFVAALRPESLIAQREQEASTLRAEARRRRATSGTTTTTSWVAEAEARAVLAEDALRNAQAAPPALPGVLYHGDLVKIPKQPTELGGIFPLSEVTDEETRLFGRDLLVSEYDLVWDPEARDLKMVSGLDNIQQVQRHYFYLRPRELRHAPGVGNFAWEDQGQWQGHGQSRLLALAVHKTLTQDPRIRTISNLQAITYAGISTISFSVELINGLHVPRMSVEARA